MKFFAGFGGGWPLETEDRDGDPLVNNGNLYTLALGARFKLILRLLID